MKNWSWKDQKKYLCKTIKEISDKFGGDDLEWLRDYARLVVEQYGDRLEVAIACFEDVLRGTKEGCREIKGSSATRGL